jgi:hypothetical protein
MPNLKNFGKNKRSITNENMNCPSNLWNILSIVITYLILNWNYYCRVCVVTMGDER